MGGRLADGQKMAKIFGEPYDVRADVVQIPGLSAHAGQDLLVRYAASIKQQVKKVFLIHGEQDAADALTAKLKEASLREVFYPALHSAVDL